MTFSGNMKESKPRSMKDTWETELGYGWTRSGQRRCHGHRPPESTMSVSSDIRFTRRKLSRPCRGCCAAAAALLVLLLLAAMAVALAHMYLFGDPLNRQTFRGSFVVTSWQQEGTDLALKGNGTREGELKHALVQMYRSSDLKSCFVDADILALDSLSDGTRVHFEVSFEPIFTSVSTAEVASVIATELEEDGARFLRGYTTMADSLQIEENSVISSQALLEPETTALDTPTTEAISSAVVEELRECSQVDLPLCSQYLTYNMTSYPNLVGHPNRDVLMRDLVAFRELLDAECSHLAQDFVCQMLQPRCKEDRVVRPCRSYCRAFHSGCGDRLPERLKQFFDCSRFPDFFGRGSCAPEPGCLASLQRLALSRRSCDGVPDCADALDERGCAQCAGAGAGALRCALHARCLPAHLRCDGTPDCPDGSDEAGCLWVSRSLAWWRRESSESTLGAVRSRAGYAVWAERGRAGKICAAPYEHDKKALASVAASLCKALTFKAAISAEVVPDAEADEEFNSLNSTNQPEYVEVVDPFAREISFQKSACPDRKVMKVVCDQLQCGIASARGVQASKGVEGLSRSAQPGDWPWHAALFRSHVHACDAALVHPSWLVTTASCFQGQPKAEWTARLGTVRTQSTTPWQQEQRIVGMVRSPVEGSMLALVRLEEPVEMTDFVRPVCLQESTPTEHGVCNTLGWTRNRDQLQRVHIVTSPMPTCENVSIATVNGICAEPLYDQDDCDEEEYAGSSMMCFDEKEKHWSLVGVSGWRIACTKIGLGRPRIYDAINSHIDWIRRTIQNSSR